MVEIIPVNIRSKALVDEYLRLPFRLYAETPQWVPPLDRDVRLIFDLNKNPFYKSGQAHFLIARRENKSVGRLAVLDNRNWNEYNRKKVAFFYQFECEDDEEAAAKMFENAFDWARQRGLDTMVGPKGFSVFDGLGMLVKGFEHRPAYGLPYNLPYYPKLVEACGFSLEAEIVSGYLDRSIQFPEEIHQIAERVKQRRGLQIWNFKSRSELRALVPILTKLYNESLGEADGNVPISNEEGKALADQLIRFADPRLIKIVMKGNKPIGFLFAYPDISAAVQRIHGRFWPFGWLQLLIELKRTPWININGAGMIEQYRGLGGTAILFSEMFKSFQQSHYQYADIVQIGVENDNMQREMRRLGINFYKTHRVYQRKI